MSRLIGLDHGSRRIGVAVGDTETGMAFARPAIRRRRLLADVAAVEALFTSEAAETV
ncbi:MAG: Holliday junction resolvase RuvX, partial [Candidatus Limnocylindria bacterium]